MAEVQILGLFHEATPTADTLAQLRQLGVADDKIMVMSSIPYSAEVLGRPRPRRRVALIALLGAVHGLLLGLILTVGLFLLYPIVQGGQPIVPIPPTLIVLFETTMLGTMVFTFFGLLGENRFPAFKPQVYDPRITEGHIGVLIEVAPGLAEQTEKILQDNGAHHLERIEPTPQRWLFPERVPHQAPDLSYWIDRGYLIFWGVIVAGVIALAVLVLLVAYSVIDIPIPTQMADQPSIASQQGPRLAAPAAAVPVQGPVLIAGQPASEPLPATADSLQRGKILYGVTCIVCHGESGKGDGKLSVFFEPRPADLTSDRVQSLSDQQLFLVITQGRGIMPSLAENLSVQDRWDVINYIRTWKK